MGCNSFLIVLYARNYQRLGVLFEELKKEIEARGVKMPPFYGLALDDESVDMDKILADFDGFIQRVLA